MTELVPDMTIVPDEAMVRRINACSRLLGVPFQFCPLTKRMTFAPSAILKMVFSILFVNSSMVLVPALMFVKYGSMNWDVFNSTIGESSLDYLVISFMAVTVTVGLIIMIIIIWRSSDAIADIFSDLSNLDQLPETFGQVKARGVVTFMFKGVALIVSIVGGLSLFYSHQMVTVMFGPVKWALETESILKMTMISLTPVSTVVCFMNPCGLSIIILLLYILGLLDEMFETLGNLLESHPNKKIVVNLGFAMCDIVGAANVAIQPLLLFLFVNFLFLLTMHMYSGLSSFFFQSSNFGIIQNIFYLSICTLSFWTLSLLCRHGQLVQDSRAKAKKALGMAIRSMADCGNDPLLTQMHLLKENLGQPNPIAPYSMFGLNNASFLTTLATIVTYLIVLLQFRGAA